MSPSNTFWWIMLPFPMLKTILYTAMKKLFGVLVGTVKIRVATFPQTHDKDQMAESRKWITRKSHGAAPCWSNPNDPNELWSKGLEAKGMQARRSGNALLKHPQFPGIACGDAYVSLRTPGCCLSGLIAFPLQWTTGFWTWLTWTKLNKSITDDPRWHDPKCTKVSWLLHSAAPSDAFLCPCPFLCPFPYRLCLQTRRTGKDGSAPAISKCIKKNLGASLQFHYSISIARIHIYIYMCVCLHVERLLNHTYNLYMHTSSSCKWDTALIRQLGSFQYFAATEHWTLIKSIASLLLICCNML